MATILTKEDTRMIVPKCIRKHDGMGYLKARPHQLIGTRV